MGFQILCLRKILVVNMLTIVLLTIWWDSTYCLAESSVADVSNVMKPRILRESPSNEACPVLLPDGTLKVFYRKSSEERTDLYSITSHDNGESWGEETVELLFQQPGGYGIEVLLDKRGELHFFAQVFRGESGEIAVDRFLDVWYARTSNHRKKWTKPRKLYEGWIGALRDADWLDSGRLLLPLQSWIGGRSVAPPVGTHFCTALYSDDAGESWDQSAARLVAPCYRNFNGNNYGAVEPVVQELPDGRLWMLMRTQTGWLYESFSNDSGGNWTIPRPSFFPSSSSPAEILELKDGRILVLWNNCMQPARVNGNGVYGGRDALHAAISEDMGRRWQGFREVFRDPLRHVSPPKRGDRGTAYPNAVELPDGSVLVATGQGKGHRAILKFHPNWLYESWADADFSDGIEKWHLFKQFGPATAWWRNREQGPDLIDDPIRSGRSVLHVRKPDERPGDSAVWNFPAGSRGELTIKIYLSKGFESVIIALLDRFANPTDPQGREIALFELVVLQNGRVYPDIHLPVEKWFTLKFKWDLNTQQCQVQVEGREKLILPQITATDLGASYLRIESTATAIDTAGIMIESVAVDILNPYMYRY